MSGNLSYAPWIYIYIYIYVCVCACVCTATYHSSQKLPKLDEPDMQDTAGEVGTSSYVMYSCEPLHMAEERQDTPARTYI